jgi:protease II
MARPARKRSPFRSKATSRKPSDPRRRGITIKLQSFVVPPTTFAYDPDKGSFSDLEIGLAPPDYDSGRYETSDLEAKAEDGVMVLDTLVHPKNVKGHRSLLSSPMARTVIRSLPISVSVP